MPVRSPRPTGTGGNPLQVSTIQIIAITGDDSAMITNNASNSGSSTAPVFKLGAAPGANSLEILFGAPSRAQGGTQATWSPTVPAGYTQVAVETDLGNPSISASVYDGVASSSLTGSLATTDPWGTIGLEDPAIMIKKSFLGMPGAGLTNKLQIDAVSGHRGHRSSWRGPQRSENGAILIFALFTSWP